MNGHLALCRDYRAALGIDDAATTISSPDPGSFLAATLPVWELAAGSVAAFASAATRLSASAGLPARPVKLSPDRIVASFSGDRLLRIDGTPVSGFAELSGFFAARDGWVRTHANYPHHRRRLLATVDLGEDADRTRFETRIAAITADEVENAAADAGAIAVRVRDESEWLASAPGRSVAAEPLVTVTRREDRAVITDRWRPTPDRPLDGLRVLDFTRVIAGPVCTRALALLGARVLRIDPPDPAEIAWQHLETGQGKASAVLDVHSAAGRRRVADLLATADIVVTGYRPGALADLPLAPGTIHGSVRAWGYSGPWANRRGFDSIVQAASGIALIEGTPGALPAQALDHGSGYLLAAAIVDSMISRSVDGYGRDVRVSLARTARWLADAPGRNLEHPPAGLPGAECTATHGSVRAARPALAEYDDYPYPAHPNGSDPALWDACRTTQPS